jgi:hypothetical protein
VKLARLDLREDGIAFDLLEVVGDPVDDLVAVTTEVSGAHVAGLRRYAARITLFWVHALIPPRNKS